MVVQGFGAGFATVLISYFLGRVAGFFLGLVKRS